METSRGKFILLKQRRWAVQPTETLISIPNASDMVGRCCFWGLEWRAGSCHLSAVLRVKAVMAARPDWCTMSWMPAKMSPLQTSHISDGPFNSHGVEGRLNSWKENKKEGDNSISCEHGNEQKHLRNVCRYLNWNSEIMKMADNCFPSQRFIIPCALSKAWTKARIHKICNLALTFGRVQQVPICVWGAERSREREEWWPL